MIATDRFIHLHLHKSGGRIVNECLLQFFPKAARLGHNLPRHLIPDQLAGLPVLGFVRNPWAYYVAWFEFQSQRPQPNALFRTASDNGQLDFNDTVGNLLRLGSDNTMLDRVLDGLPREYSGQGLNLPAFALEPIRGSGMGFYSYLYHYMYGEPDSSLFVGRMENLRDDLLNFFARVGVEVTGPMRQFVQARSLHASAIAGCEARYTQTLADEVARRDRYLVEVFNYKLAS